MRNRVREVTGHGVAPAYAEVAALQTGYVVTGRPRCKEEARAAYWELRKRADDAADGVPCDHILRERVRSVTDRGRHGPAPHCLGFSLMELMVVLGIVAVLAMIAVPLMTDNIPRFQLKSAVRTLVADFQRAKTEAVKRNCSVEIRFSPGAYTPEGGAGSYQLVEMNGGTVLLTRTMPKWVTLYKTNFSGDTTGYTSQGLPIGASGSVYLRNNKSVFYKVSISTAGYVSMTISGSDPS